MRRSRKKGARKGRAGIFRLGGRSHRGLFGRGRRSKSGVFGIDAALVIAFLTIIMSLVGTILVGALPSIVEGVGRGIGLTPLLIHVPGMAGQPLFGATIISEVGALESSDAQVFFAKLSTVSTVMGDIYSKMQVVAFVGFVIAAILMGITYVSEQFNLVSKGTAFQLLSESGLILVLLFIFPIIYNASAAAVNTLNQRVILTATFPENHYFAGTTATPVKMMDDVIHAATSFGARGLSWDITKDFGTIVLSVMQGTVAFGAILAAAMAGVGRLLIIAILVGAFPLILIFRLIPPLRNIAATLQGALIGLMVGAILASLVMRVSWGILCAGLDPMAAWAFGCGTLVILSLVTFVVASGFGGVSRAMQGAVVGPASATVGGMIAAGGAAAGGVITGGAASFATVRGATGMTGREKLQAVAAGMRTGAQVGPTKALLAGREVALEAGDKALLRELGLPEGTSIAGKFAHYAASPNFAEAWNWLNKEKQHQRKITEAELAGSRVAELNEGRMNAEMLKRMAAKSFSKNDKEFNRMYTRIDHMMKTGKLSRGDLERGLKKAYSDWANSSLGSDGAAIALNGLANESIGRPPLGYYGQGETVPPSKAGGKTEPETAPLTAEPETAPLTAEQEIKDSYITARERAQRRMADHEGARKRRSLSKD